MATFKEVKNSTTLEKENLESLLLETMTDGVIFIHVADFQIVYTNSKFEHLFGYEKGELIGKPVSVVNYDDGSGSSIETTKKIMKALETRGEWRGEVHNCRKDRSPFWCYARVLPFKHPAWGDIWVSIQLDITEDKKAAQERFAQQQLLKSIIDCSPSHIFTVDLENHFTLVNRSMTEFHGVPAEEALGKDCYRLLPQPLAEHLRSENREVISSGEILVKEREITSARRNRSSTMISEKFPLRDENGTIVGMGGVLTDITNQKKLETELRAAKVAAEAASKSREKFLDIAAHELKNPVTAINLLLQLAQRQARNGSPVPPDFLQRLQDSAERMARLVVDLLDLARLERDRIALKIIPTDLASLVRKVLDEMQLRDPERPFKFSKPEGPIQLELDPVLIHQVVSNLLDNAMKYTSADDPIEITLQYSSDQIRVSIKDSGPEIPEERLTRLFAGLDGDIPTPTPRMSGLGLGLSVCRGIVELHGGTIGAQSELGRGSEFYFELPLKNKIECRDLPHRSPEYSKAP